MAHLSTLEGFVCGGLAGCTAVTFSNPAEVAKTRLQLQGELMKGGGGERVYKNVFDVLLKAWRNEGFRGVQRGLGPAHSTQYFYQVALNGSRLGLYEPIRRWANGQLGYSPTRQVTLTSMGAGAVSAVVGSYLGNPLFLVKTRMQAYSPALPVGAQSTWTFLASSSIAGVILCLVMQPADTTLTRMYNQPTVKGPNGRTVGTLYKNPVDCLWKTFKAEGIRGWYKGTTAHFLRIAPHTIITLTANDIIVRLYLKARHRSD
uniref:Calcium dependent mitochondrial carrier protein n=1 Tax=Ganoderma boninense TaxID=34458 RepID=A0A5K1K195_9APHY|nr:Calcium dependent mitochondrial carrier protein [Ganoderma boninense]